MIVRVRLYLTWGVLLLGVLCLGVGVGGLFRKQVLEPERVVAVVVDAPPTSSKFFRPEQEYTGVGCIVRDARCVCDTPYGALSWWSFVDCDVMRQHLYWSRKP